MLIKVRRSDGVFTSKRTKTIWAMSASLPTISPLHGAPVENNDSDVNFSSGIQQWELNSTAATKQQLYLVENMHAYPRIGAEVALAPVQQTEL